MHTIHINVIQVTHKEVGAYCLWRSASTDSWRCGAATVFEYKAVSGVACTSSCLTGSAKATSLPDAKSGFMCCLCSWRCCLRFLSTQALHIRWVFASPYQRHTGVWVVPHQEQVYTRKAIWYNFQRRPSDRVWGICSDKDIVAALQLQSLMWWYLHNHLKFLVMVDHLKLHAQWSHLFWRSSIYVCYQRLITWRFICWHEIVASSMRTAVTVNPRQD